MDKYTIIGGDIHKLVKLNKDIEWKKHAWRIHQEGCLYWVPIPNDKFDSTKHRWMQVEIDPSKCSLCKKRKS